MTQASLKNFLEEIKKLYTSIDLFMLNLKKKLRLIIALQISPEEALLALQEERAFEKNKRRTENFYFAPSRSQKTFKWLFLDDVNPQKLKDYEAIIVQTSEKKYQAYIKLDRELKAGEYPEVARQVVRAFEADKAVVDEYHLRRLPGFFNTKYNPPYLVSWRKKVGRPLKIQAHAPTLRRWKKILTPQTGGGVCLERKTWHQFYSPTAPSYSEADFAFACYLLKLGYQPEQVKDILRQESPQLPKRHHNVEDYLNRTLQAALRRVYGSHNLS